MGTTAELVVPGQTGISRLAVGDATLYALDSAHDLVIGPAPPLDTVYAVDLVTWKVTPLFSAEFVTGIFPLDATLYWTTPYDLRARASDGTTTVLITDPTQTKPMGDVLYDIGGKIVTTVGSTGRSTIP